MGGSRFEVEGAYRFALLAADFGVLRLEVCVSQITKLLIYMNMRISIFLSVYIQMIKNNYMCIYNPNSSYRFALLTADLQVLGLEVFVLVADALVERVHILLHLLSCVTFRIYGVIVSGFEI